MKQQSPHDIVKNNPLKRWAKENEADEALVFLLTCQAYITDEIIHLDDGRHLI